MLGKHFEKNFSIDSNAIDSELRSRAEQTVNDLIENLDCVLHFNGSCNALNVKNSRAEGAERFADVANIHLILSRLNSKKSFGFDGISNFLLKHSSDIVCKHLTAIFNQCINIGYFPNIWKLADVKPICKPNKPPSSCDSYRPIALLSNVSKVFEAFLLQQLNLKIEESDNILKPFQMGFRSSYSTMYPLVYFTDELSDALNKKYGTIAILLDVSKAFDTVYTTGLIYKMIKYGFDPYLIKVIYSFLQNRSFKVTCEEALSQVYKMTSCVPQGAILSPVLYNLFLSDFPLAIDSRVKTIAYADDILIFGSFPVLKTGTEVMNSYLEVIHKYYSDWGVSINVNKCEAIKFRDPRNSYKNCRVYQPTFKIGDNTVPIKRKVKYLGVIFDERLEFGAHAARNLNLAKVAYFNWRLVLHKSRIKNIKIKKLIYTLAIRSHLSYAFPIWFNIAKLQLSKIITFERRIFRRILNKGCYRRSDGEWRYFRNKYIYKKIKMPWFYGFCNRLGLKMINNLKFSDNIIIRNMFEKSNQVYGRKFSPRLYPFLNEKGIFDIGEDYLPYFNTLNDQQKLDLAYLLDG